MKATDPTPVPDAADRARDAELPALTGLRLFAALSVAIGHGWAHIGRFPPPDPFREWVRTMPSFGMTMFFVLSGFVIHYNYRRLVTAQGAAGVGAFLWARFARLYPLFLLVLAFDVLLGHRLWELLAGTGTGLFEQLRALPYYFLFVQSWIYVPFNDNSLIYVAGSNLALTWSISTEWFFYLAYPLIAVLVLRARRPAVIFALIVGWSALWGAFALSLDSRAPAIDAWATGHYGELASLAAGYQDSFVRWLTYFSPYVRIGEFVLGCLTAQLYLTLRERPVSVREQAFGRALAVFGVLSIPLVIFLSNSPDHSAPLLVGLRNNYGLAPSVAILLFAAARYENGLSRFLRARVIVGLGEASYSIYLIHFATFILIANYLGDPLPATLPNIIYTVVRFLFSLSLVCLISLGFHAVVEAPSRRWLRGLWSPRGMRRPAWATVVAALPVLAVPACLATAGALFPSGREVASGIRLISATYGGSCGARRGNASELVRRACNGRESCDYVVDVVKLGDPKGGCPKDFVAQYACMPGDAARKLALQAEAGLGSHALLACGVTDSQASAAPAP